MSLVYCSCCKQEWDASIVPKCPICLGNDWMNAPNFIRQKHDPHYLPSSSPMYRSVLTTDVVDNLQEFVDYAANSGTCYYNNKHDKYLYFVGDPLGVIPGSAILPNESMPRYALDGLLIADPFSHPHAYAASQVDFRATIVTGESSPISKCSVSGCDNLREPYKDKCIRHRE